MSSIGCEALQFCLDSQLAEQRAIHRRRQSAQLHHLSFLYAAEDQPGSLKPLAIDECNDIRQTETEYSSFSSITSLADAPLQEKSSFCDQPLPARWCGPAEPFDERRLELCTENLGCETGAYFPGDCSFFSTLPPVLPLPPCTPSCSREEFERIVEERRPVKAATKVKVDRKARLAPCPPPLTTLANGASIQVRPQRADGKLVLKAMPAPFPSACFRAERSEGRLRLHLLQERAPLPPCRQAAKTEEADPEGFLDTRKDVNGNEIHGDEDEKEVGEGIGVIHRGCCNESCDGDHKNRSLLNLKPRWVASS